MDSIFSKTTTTTGKIRKLRASERVQWVVCTVQCNLHTYIADVPDTQWVGEIGITAIRRVESLNNIPKVVASAITTTMRF